MSLINEFDIFKVNTISPKTTGGSITIDAVTIENSTITASEIISNGTLFLNGNAFGGLSYIDIQGSQLRSGYLNFNSQYYATGTASQSGTIVTGVGTTWIDDMQGGVIRYADGTAINILQVNSATSLTVDFSATKASQAYEISYDGIQSGVIGTVGVDGLYTNTITGQGIVTIKSLPEILGTQGIVLNAGNQLIKFGGTLYGDPTIADANIVLNGDVSNICFSVFITGESDARYSLTGDGEAFWRYSNTSTLASRLTPTTDGVMDWWAGTVGSPKGALIKLGNIGYRNRTDTATAFAGGGQANATLITTFVTIFTTVATAGDSGKMPASPVDGARYVVTNLGANSMNLFPNTGQAFMNNAPNSALALGVGTTLTMYYLSASSKWILE